MNHLEVCRIDLHLPNFGLDAEAGPPLLVGYHLGCRLRASIRLENFLMKLVILKLGSKVIYLNFLKFVQSLVILLDSGSRRKSPE